LRLHSIDAPKPHGCPASVNPVLEVIGPLRQAGFALHWLHPRSKRPIGDSWSEKPVLSAEKLRETYSRGNNLGVRLGEYSRVGDLFLHVFDVDIRKPELKAEAFAALQALIPEYERLPTVQSGSGGESRHYHFLSDRAFGSRKLAHSAGSFVDAKGKTHWDWEIELIGTRKQVVLPPSIHPDSGKPYRWLREFDFDLVDMGLGPVIPADVIGSLAPETAAPEIGDEDDEFRAQVYGAAIADVTPEKIRETMALLPLPTWCEDRDGWVQTGAALHHQFSGAEEGYKLWSDFSRQSPKFDERDQWRVWKSFSTNRRRGTTFRTLLQAAGVERARRAAEASDIDDLIGEIADAPDPDAPKVAWRSLLVRSADEKKSITSGLPNAVLIVANDRRTKGLPQLNLFTQDIVQRHKPGRHVMEKMGPKGCKQLVGPIWEVRDPVNGDLWTEIKDVSLRHVLESPERQGGYGIKLTDRDLKGAVIMAARENAFHPVREYLIGQRWDGRERVETLFVDYLGAPDDAYTRSVARMFLVAAVTRVFEPGHKFDFAVILEGLQGKRKTSFIETLARHWFAELDGDFGETKGMVEVMQGAWILELPELAGFGKSDVRQIKAFISRKTDKVRLAYERRAAEFPRQCVFIGSTNDDDYLRDDTGGRRFWPIHCEVAAINTDKLGREVDQIWAEAHGIYLAMRRTQPDGTLPLYLADADAAADAIEIQESRRMESAEDGMAGRISEWLDQPATDENGFEDEAPQPRNQFCLLQIWVECFHRDVANYGSPQAQQLGRAIKKLRGWYQAPQQTRVPKYGKQRVFHRDGWVGV
jgi:predicted P-loop ATPase